MSRHLNYLLVLALGFLTPFAVADDSVPVYGKPGGGRIQVRVLGNFDNPGFYWLEAGAKLPELVTRARVNFKRKGEFDSPPIILIIRQRDGKAQKIRYWTSWHDRLILDPKGNDFSLEHGDVVKTDYVLF